MFNRQMVTDENVRKASDEIFQYLVSVGMYPNVHGYIKENFYRAIYYFVSIIELLDRRGELSYDAYCSYKKIVDEETALKRDFESHEKRCREVLQEGDFILNAARKYENTDSDVMLVMPVVNFIGFSEKNYNSAVSCCRKYMG